jgi:hypothetical protein
VFFLLPDRLGICIRLSTSGGTILEGGCRVYFRGASRRCAVASFLEGLGGLDAALHSHGSAPFAHLLWPVSHEYSALPQIRHAIQYPNSTTTH